MNIIRPFLSAALLASAATLSACQPHAHTQPVARAVKLETIAAAASGDVRFVATVRQRERAELAFGQPGRIAVVLADVGDPVRAGQVLARLDPEPARLKLRQADANVAAANAQVRERAEQLRLQRAMFDDGAAAQTTLTAAATALQAAQAQLEAAQAERGIAARALRLSVLTAPFDGRVVTRLAQPGTEIGPGQAVFQVDGDGPAQAQAALPAAAAAALHAGDRVAARTAAGATLALRVRGVGTRLEHGAAVTVLFDVAAPAPAVRADESLQLVLPADGTPVLSVPLAALLQDRPGDTAAVWVYHPDEGIVRRRAVRLGTLRGERVEVRAGLRAGEQVVGVGAAFLGDGQKVTPLPPVFGGRA